MRFFFVTLSVKHERAHSRFFFLLSYLFFLCSWWISTKYALGSRPNVFFFAMLRLLCFSPEHILFHIQWLSTKRGWGKKTRNGTERGTIVWGKPVTQRFHTCLISLWPTCDKVKVFAKTLMLPKGICQKSDVTSVPKTGFNWGKMRFFFIK